MFIALQFGGLVIVSVYKFQLVPAIIPWQTLLPFSLKVLIMSLFLFIFFFIIHSRMHSLSFQKVANLIPHTHTHPQF